MRPVLTEISHNVATIQPTIALAGIIDQLSSAIAPWRRFLQANVGPHELAVLQPETVRASDDELGTKQKIQPIEPDLLVLFSAFTLSEIKRGFLLGFLLLLPFLAIDLVVANILVGLGLTLISPIIVSLPLKVVLFVTSDGWLRLTEGLIHSYR